MYLGLDLGTSGLKAILIDASQRVLAEVTEPLTVARPHPGWSEQSPSDWVGAASRALDRLAADRSLAPTRGIGLSGQMHGAVAIDAKGDVLRPAILWNDTRSHEEAARLDADPAFRKLSGNIVFPGFTAPKIAWMRAHEPHLADQIDKVLLPKDYLRLWLTGEVVSDMSDAAGTAWLDTGLRDWSDTLLAATGLGRDHMADLVEGNAPSGTLRPELAARWGLGRDVVVAGGAGDNAATAIGLGAVAPGQGFVSLGTSGVLFVATRGFAPDPATAVHTFCHAVPETWHQMGVILAATDALNWAGALMGRDPADLTAGLDAPADPRGQPLFLPYLGGERTPHNDAMIRGILSGISHVTDAEVLTRAVLDGVAFAFRDCLDALVATGTRADSLMAVGGGAKSEVWLKTIATVLGEELLVPKAGDFGAAYGAARLGQMAAEGGGAELAPPVPSARRIAPDPRLQEAYAEALAKYRATYHALKELTP